jgi:ribonuclease H2 subunit A
MCPRYPSRPALFLYAADHEVIQIYVDTVGPPSTYQSKLSRIFPSCSVTVSKKADSLYPSVSVASVVAKVTRDTAVETILNNTLSTENGGGTEVNCGSGYPSDPKTVAWLRESMDPVFGWGAETRFSWSTAAEMLKKSGRVVEWPEEEDGSMHVTDFFGEGSVMSGKGKVAGWYGRPVGEMGL